jgi:hypothetical protein
MAAVKGLGYVARAINIARVRNVASGIRNGTAEVIGGGGGPCGDIAMAAENTFAGTPRAAKNVSSTPMEAVESRMGGTFTKGGTLEEVTAVMSREGSGARGIVLGQDVLTGAGHAWNVTNNFGVINQIDAAAPWVANTASFDMFRVMVTQPGVGSFLESTLPAAGAALGGFMGVTQDPQE